jgi:hypothetical protein
MTKFLIRSARFIYINLLKITFVHKFNEHVIEINTIHRANEILRKKDHLRKVAWNQREQKHREALTRITKTHDDAFNRFSIESERAIQQERETIKTEREDIARERTHMEKERRELDILTDELSERVHFYDRIHRRLERATKIWEDLVIEKDELKYDLNKAISEIKTRKDKFKQLKVKLDEDVKLLTSRYHVSPSHN